MNKLDLVKLINEKPYQKNNLQKGIHGIVIDFNIDNANVLFFNPKNVGDYAIVNVKLIDITLEKEKLPIEIQNEITANINTIVKNKKTYLKPATIDEYDMVELLVEDEKYTKFGVHKGETGCVMDNNAVQDYIEVDFSGIDENGEYYGDCISVKIEDLRIIK